MVDSLPSIYALIHPDTGALRYIGKAGNVRDRFWRHMRDARRRNTPLYAWIRKLAAVGKQPEYVVIEEGCKDWQSRERYFIARARQTTPDLLNLADGGDEPYCSPEVRSANGYKTARGFVDGTHKPKKDITRERLIIDTYGWVLQSYIQLGRTEKAEAVKAKMREHYVEDPKKFKVWANV